LSEKDLDSNLSKNIQVYLYIIDIH